MAEGLSLGRLLRASGVGEGVAFTSCSQSNEHPQTRERPEAQGRGLSMRRFHGGSPTGGSGPPAGQSRHHSPRLCSHPSLMTETSLMLLSPRGTERRCCLPGGPQAAWRPAGEKGTVAILRTSVATLKPCYPLSTAEQTRLLNAVKCSTKPQSTPPWLPTRRAWIPHLHWPVAKRN